MSHRDIVAAVYGLAAGVLLGYLLKTAEVIGMLT